MPMFDPKQWHQQHLSNDSYNAVFVHGDAVENVCFTDVEQVSFLRQVLLLDIFESCPTITRITAIARIGCVPGKGSFR